MSMSRLLLLFLGPVLMVSAGELVLLLGGWETLSENLGRHYYYGCDNLFWV
jgi:hypothetical protein